MKYSYKGIAFVGVSHSDKIHIRSAVDFVFNVSVAGLEVEITKHRFEEATENKLNAIIEVYGDGDEDDLFVITLLRRKFNSTDGSMWATLVHELTHYKQILSGSLNLPGTNNTALPLEEYMKGWFEVEAHQQQFAYRRATEGKVPEDSYFVMKYSELGYTI